MRFVCCGAQLWLIISTAKTWFWTRTALLYLLHGDGASSHCRIAFMSDLVAVRKTRRTLTTMTRKKKRRKRRNPKKKRAMVKMETSQSSQELSDGNSRRNRPPKRPKLSTRRKRTRIS